MKRILTLLMLLFAAVSVQAQRDMTEPRPIWFGVNMGATWQTSDMKPVGGIGWGITVARYTRVSNPSPLYFGWRFRFLDGRNFGYNYNRQTLPQINANPVLAQHYGGTTPDTSGAFGNYKMRFDEFAFELIVGSNSLRKHGVLLYGFGGAGLNYWKTTSDILGGGNTPYSYAGFSGGNADQVRDDLDGLLDEEYETDATGQGATWSFMPSAGFGFGYQWSNFMIGVEHRTTWALTDLIDGTQYNHLGAATGNNDLYHYDGLVMRWNFNSHSNNNSTYIPPPPPPNPNGYNNPANTNPNVNNNPVTTNPDPDWDNTPQQNNTNPIPLPPQVKFVVPSSTPYTATAQVQNFTVEVKNCTSVGQVTLIINNQMSTAFNFNPQTGVMTFTHTLNPGNNTYQVVANNLVGQASDNQVVIYKDQTPSALPPVVNITVPGTNPYTSTTQTTPVTASVLNVSNAAGIIVRRNGVSITNFTFDPNTHLVNFTANLQTGNNIFEVVGTNSVGSASDAVTIVYGNSQTPPAVQPPVVTITNPAVCPYQTKTANMTITANITNVTQASQVNVTFNNSNITNFTFAAQQGYASISFPVTLNAGVNTVKIKGTNTAGTDSKSCDITYKTTAPVPPPTVTITTPSANPHTATAAPFTLVATVLNVAGANEIAVTVNNQTVQGWTYNASTKVLNYPTTLNAGTTVFTVSASNQNGSDSKSQTVIYNPPSMLPPVVDIMSPIGDPYYTTNPQQTVTAKVLNVTSQSQITVTEYPSTNLPFTWDPNTNMVTFNVTLVNGLNRYRVTATNPAGTDHDVAKLELKRVDPQPNNPGNPGSGNMNSGNNNSPTSGQSSGTSKPGQTTVSGPTSGVTQGGSKPGETTSGQGSNTQAPSGQGNMNSNSNNNNGPTPPGNQAAPSIVLVTPSTNSATTSSQNYAVTMTVNNVASASAITVKVNNVVKTSGVNYNPTTKSLTFTATLVSGVNNIQVTATNNNGNASQTIAVTYTPSNKTTKPGASKPGASSSGSGNKTEEKKEEPKKDQPKSAQPSEAPSRGPAGSTGSTGVSRPRK